MKKLLFLLLLFTIILTGCTAQQNSHNSDNSSSNETTDASDLNSSSPENNLGTSEEELNKVKALNIKEAKIIYNFSISVLELHITYENSNKFTVYGKTPLMSNGYSLNSVFKECDCYENVQNQDDYFKQSDSICSRTYYFSKDKMIPYYMGTHTVSFSLYDDLTSDFSVYFGPMYRYNTIGENATDFDYEPSDNSNSVYCKKDDIYYKVNIYHESLVNGDYKNMFSGVSYYILRKNNDKVRIGDYALNLKGYKLKEINQISKVYSVDDIVTIDGCAYWFEYDPE